MKARWTVRLVEVERRIAEVELLTAALTETMLARMAAGGDAGAAERSLWRHMDELTILRRKRERLERLRHGRIRAALRAKPTEKGA